MSERDDYILLPGNWTSEDAISMMEWSPGSPGLDLSPEREREGLSNHRDQNNTPLGALDTPTAGEATAPLRATGMTQTRGPGPAGQFQRHFTKPLVPFLTMVYLRAESILQAARSVHVFHMQSLYIARQALRLVILLNDLVDAEEGPDDMQQAERIDLEDDLIELLEAMEEWGAGREEGGFVGHEQHLLQIRHHYTQVFKERFYFHDIHDATSDLIYQKLVAYDERTIGKRRGYQFGSSIIEVEYWIGQEESYVESVGEPDGFPVGLETSTVTIPLSGSTADMLSNVGQEQPQQVNNQHRSVIEPTSREETDNLGPNSSKLPGQAPRNPSGGSQAGGPYATQPNRSTIKPNTTARVSMLPETMQKILAMHSGNTEESYLSTLACLEDDLRNHPDGDLIQVKRREGTDRRPGGIEIARCRDCEFSGTFQKVAEHRTSKHWGLSLWSCITSSCTLKYRRKLDLSRHHLEHHGLSTPRRSKKQRSLAGEHTTAQPIPASAPPSIQNRHERPPSRMPMSPMWSPSPSHLYRERHLAPDPASGIPPPQPHMIYDPLVVDGLLPNQLNDEDSNAGYTASTVHPANIIHGNQYGVRDTMVTDDGILAPMLATGAPEFWDSMMLPGIPWPAEDMQEAVNFEDDSDGQLSYDTGNYQQVDGY